jgi:hypothetical protein
MKTDNKVTLNADTLLELIWNATRYCIGRHSYASTFANDYWQLIRLNRDKMNENRLRFFARDIRSQISTCLQFGKGVHVKGSSNDRICYDAHSLICQWLMAHPDEAYIKGEFLVDCINGDVKYNNVQDTVGTLRRFPDIDLRIWARLADCIDRQQPIDVKYDGKTHRTNALRCLDYDNINKTWRVLWILPDKGLDRYISPECEITEIK